MAFCFSILMICFLLCFAVPPRPFLTLFVFLTTMGHWTHTHTTITNPVSQHWVGTAQSHYFLHTMHFSFSIMPLNLHWVSSGLLTCSCSVSQKIPLQPRTVGPYFYYPKTLSIISKLCHFAIPFPDYLEIRWTVSKTYPSRTPLVTFFHSENGIFIFIPYSLSVNQLFIHTRTASYLWLSYLSKVFLRSK